MKKLVFLLLLLPIFVGNSSCKVLKKTGIISEKEIVMGLKEALIVGITNGSGKVSKKDGYFNNPLIKIPFPQEFRAVEKALRDLGLGQHVDRVVETMNRAAENAAQEAKPIFTKVIREMTIKDAWGILKGEQHAATNYLKDKTFGDLTKVFRPVIKKALDKTMATKYWKDLITQYNKIPFLKKINPNLDEYVTGKALDGLFLMISKEEEDIRKNPLKRTTKVLKKVFKLQDK